MRFMDGAIYATDPLVKAFSGLGKKTSAFALSDFKLHTI